MQKKIRGTVWIHIDHIDNADGRVWVIQIPKRKWYFLFHELDIRIPLHAKPRRKTQPKAYLKGKAKQITMLKKDGRTIGVIE